MASAATDKRYQALKNLANSVSSKQGVFLITDRAEIARLCEPLKALGRTARWQGAIQNLISEVLDESNPVEWAFLQYHVYACYAAE